MRSSSESVDENVNCCDIFRFPLTVDFRDFLTLSAALVLDNLVGVTLSINRTEFDKNPFSLIYICENYYKLT